MFLASDFIHGTHALSGFPYTYSVFFWLVTDSDFDETKQDVLAPLSVKEFSGKLPHRRKGIPANGHTR